MAEGSPRRPLLGLGFLPEAAWLKAALPFFEAGQVEALEVSFDCLGAELLDWQEELLRSFSDADRLFCHGVLGSWFSAGIPVWHATWEARLGEFLDRFPCLALSEHYGVSASRLQEQGAPLSPFPSLKLRASVARRIETLSDRFSIPVGLENLAFAASRSEVLRQAQELTAILEASGGFLHLDLHNLWCQAVNFGFEPRELAKLFPLERARVLHIAGGRKIEGLRRDTHDQKVPEPVFALLEELLPQLSQVRICILERIGGTLEDPRDQAEYQADVRRLGQILAQVEGPTQAWDEGLEASEGEDPWQPRVPSQGSSPFEEREQDLASKGHSLEELARAQEAFFEVLREGGPASQLRLRLGAKLGESLSAWIEGWEDPWLEVASALTQRWGRGRKGGDPGAIRTRDL